ncbi:MAG: YkgJ family cysteine cluster protein [Leptospiraceae bacterium]|nr:YkgJ family cysteine cluster protein [Leptospiraceae bacterium]MCP5498857.1 YkgJ family cysteine cluster protein [Leptospiraceae bacterium]
MKKKKTFSKGDTPLVFPSFPNEKQMTESEICLACTGCCRYVAVGLDKPNSKELLDQYRWFLLHRNVQIYIDNDNDWNLLFITPCTQLGSDGKCGIYQDRPQLCKDYSPDSCSRVGKDHKELFETPEAMQEYLEKEKEKRRLKRESKKQNSELKVKKGGMKSEPTKKTTKKRA